MRLYDLSQSYQQILTMIEDGQDGLDDTLEALNDAIEDKVENVAKVIRTLEAEAEGLKSEEKRLSERRQSLENNIKRLKSYTEDTMIAVGVRKIKSPLFTVYIQNNAPSVEVIDDSIIPKSYFIEQAPKLDKKSILKASKEGHEVPGIQIRQTESIRIR